MTRRQPHKYKICKQVRENIWDKPISHKIKLLKNKKNKPINTSEHGMKLLAKQKLKRFYGEITEKQFFNIYLKALKSKGRTGDNLLVLLERRLDIVLYRMNFANSVFQSRQMINHKFIMVNNKIVNIPSYTLNKGDIIQLKPGKIEHLHSLLIKNVNSGTIQTNHPEYLHVNYRLMAAQMVSLPSIVSIYYPTEMSDKYVIEYYSGK